MNDNEEIKLVESQIAYLYNLRQKLNDLVIDGYIEVDSKIYKETNDIFESFNKNEKINKEKYMCLIDKYENIVAV